MCHCPHSKQLAHSVLLQLAFVFSNVQNSYYGKSSALRGSGTANRSVRILVRDNDADEDDQDNDDEDGDVGDD